ncbi:dynamin family protein [Pectobacterium polonicum]|uniref:dynamin family protein n=1 Tax=Pectobacterium polonicum TaxID=2485124 RepID=UPI002B242B13|nr:dynamin family protein [Pectobacterium polonicum]
MADVIATLDEGVIRERYSLLCQSCEDRPNGAAKEDEAILQTLESLIEQDLPTLARKGSPSTFTDILHELRHEMVRFREFCEYPELSSKVVVGLGGSFSAGKSSLINALVGDRNCLVTEVDPTTSLPTYLVKGNDGETTEVRAINLFNRLISISHKQFRTLTHEERESYGSQVSRMLKSVIVSHQGFGWENLALLDTPGYSKADEQGSARTDAGIARSQLNSAQFIIWLVPADQGTITEDDIAFLATLDRAIPKLIIVSRADKHPEETISKIITLVGKTLAQRGIEVLDILPFSNRPRQPYSVSPLAKYLDDWDCIPRDPGFTRQFKRQFMAYENYLDEARQDAQRQLSKFNRILTLSDDPSVQADILSLQRKNKASLHQLEDISQSLNVIQQQFFSGLKQIGQRLGIPLDEPESLSLLEYAPISLQKMLLALADERDMDLRDEVDTGLWQVLTWHMLPKNVERLLRRDVPEMADIWQPLMDDAPLSGLDTLLRRNHTHFTSLQTLSKGSSS